MQIKNKLSNVIKELQMMKKSHGDLPCYTQMNYECDEYEVERISYKSPEPNNQDFLGNKNPLPERILIGYSFKEQGRKNVARRDSK